MIKPIVGTLKRRIILDITMGFASGGVVATYWWHTFHKKSVTKRDNWYAEQEKLKNSE